MPKVTVDLSLEELLKLIASRAAEVSASSSRGDSSGEAVAVLREHLAALVALSNAFDDVKA